MLEVWGRRRSLHVTLHYGGSINIPTAIGSSYVIYVLGSNAVHGEDSRGSAIIESCLIQVCVYSLLM